LRDKRPPERVRVPATRATSKRAVGKVAWQMGAVIFPAEKSFGKFADHHTNLQNHLSGGEIVLQMGAVIFPAEKSFGKFAK
jgi:hypothetical protein